MRSSRFPVSPPSLYAVFDPRKPSAGLLSSKGHKKRVTSSKCGPTLTISWTISSMHTIPCFPNACEMNSRKFSDYKYGPFDANRPRSWNDVSCLFNHVIVCQRNFLVVYFCKSLLVDKFLYGSKIRIPSKETKHLQNYEQQFTREIIFKRGTLKTGMEVEDTIK